MENEVEFLKDALDHVMRTARASRTSTRRLRWIEHRCYQALKGEYVPQDLPKHDITSGEAVKRHYFRKLNELQVDDTDVVY